MKKKIYEDGNYALFETDNEEELLLKFSDDLVDARGNVKGSVRGKSSASAQIAVHLYKVLSSYHLPVRFKNQKSSKELAVKNASLFPFYNVLTNIEDDEGGVKPEIQFVLVEDGESPVEPKDLLKNEIVNAAQIAEIRRFTLKMNVILKDFFHRRALKLLGFRAQFGTLPNGRIGLCSEMTLDSCDVKDANSRTKYTTQYLLSHADDAVELYEKALSAILY